MWNAFRLYAFRYHILGINMKKLETMLVVLAVPVLCLFIGSRSAPTQEQGRKTIPVKWEYRVLQNAPFAADNSADLNSLGNDGWEMCGVSNVGTGTYCYFKRPKP